MKFSTYLEQITGVSIYPVISLALFVIFFSIVVIRIFSMSRQEVDYLENMPLHDSLQDQDHNPSL